MTVDDQLVELGLDPHPTEPPAVRIGVAGRLRSWAWFHRRSIAPLVPLLSLATLVQLRHISRSPAPFDDEGTYVAQAWAVQVRHHMAHYTYWYDHPPLGWIQLALWNWPQALLGRSAHAIVDGRDAMVIASVVSAGLLYVLARRLGLGRPAATGAVLLFTFSPLALAEHRMVLLDNIAVPWVLAAMVLAASPRRSLWAATAAGVCAGVAVLSKETFLLFTPVIVWELWRHCDRKTRSFCVTGFTVALGMVVISFPLYALLKGELFPGAGHVSLLDAIRFQLVGRTPSGSVLDHTSSARATVDSWFALDPWLLGGGLLAASVAFCSKTMRAVRPFALAWVILVLAVARGGYLPGPFVTGALPLAALLVAAAGDAIAGFTTAHDTALPVRRAAGAATVGLLLLVVAAGPRWIRRDHALLSSDEAAPTWDAERWVAANLPRDQRLIVDDTMWLDLVRQGFDEHTGVVWFFKLDATNNLDPSVAQRLPNGWREFNYIVSTPYLRRSLLELPGGLQPVRDALTSSTVVATFGQGNDAVEIRAINPAPQS
jgi:hypothetical protein